MFDSIEDHRWIETPRWRWCRTCGAYQKRLDLEYEWNLPMAEECPGTPFQPSKALQATKPGSDLSRSP